MSEHDLALPWADQSKTGQSLSDANGVPVAVTLNYTSIRSRDADGITYNTSDYAGPIRSEFILRAVNSHARLIEALEKAREFIADEYRDSSQEPAGEWLAPEARPVHGLICDAIAQAREDGK